MTDAKQAVDAAFATTAWRWERIIAIVRVVLSVIMIARSAWIWSYSSRAWLIVPMSAVVGLYIVASILVVRSRAPIERVLKISVALDAVGVFAALLPNTLWPWQGYRGIVNTPDLAGLSLATLVAGLRISPSAALLGSLLNCLAFAALAAVDVEVSAMPPPGERAYQYLMQGASLVTVAVLANLIAVRTRRLVERSVRAVLTAERAQRSFGAILHEHHDLRSMLSAVRLNADRLVGEGPPALGNLVGDLRSDLDDVEARLNAIRAHAYGELLTLGTRYPVDVGAVARDVIGRLGRRFPSVALVLRIEGDIEAEVAGGDATLRRVLFNLVINACEGDGERGATRVDIAVRGDRAQRCIGVDIVDDGPGFPLELLDTRLGETRSTKAGGSGFGLGVAFALTQASGGTLVRGNRSTGAIVSLSLPMMAAR